MNLWIAISLVLGVISIYLFVIEIYFVAFKLTGLATNKIKFQVASLFTGSGFTTTESELIVNDDKRRKIAIACMYTGHIFSVMFMGLVINVFFSIGQHFTNQHTTPTFYEWYFIVLYVVFALFLMVLFLKIPPINKRFQDLLEKIAINSSRKNRHTNLVTVLDLYGKHAIVEVVLNVIPNELKDIPLCEMGLTKGYSINVLSIKRGTRIVDVSKDTMFKKGDILVIYGLTSDIKEVFVKSLSKDKKDVIVVDHSNDISLVSNYGDNALVEVYIDEVPSEFVDVKMMDANLKGKYGITVGIIKRNDKYVTVSKDTIILKGDTLTLFGPYKTIKMLFKND